MVRGLSGYDTSSLKSRAEKRNVLCMGRASAREKLAEFVKVQVRPLWILPRCSPCFQTVKVKD